MIVEAFIVERWTAWREERPGIAVLMGEMMEMERRGLLLGHGI